MYIRNISSSVASKIKVTLYLNTEEYEDYSDDYWDREWITDYYDNQGIGDKITSTIRFAEDCVDDRRYEEAGEIYE